MFSTDVLLTILKVSAGIIAAAYGVYATVTDFRIEKNGKKVLSAKGKWGIALFLFSIVLTMSSDEYKDYEDKIASKQRDDRETEIARLAEDTVNKLRVELQKTEAINGDLSETRKTLNKTADTTASVLNETKRAAEAFNLNDRFEVTFDTFIPLDQGDLVRPYIQRTSDSPDQVSPGVPGPHSLIDLLKRT